MEMKAVERNWEDLPPELFHLIVKKLYISDFIRFRAVCKTWRSSISVSDLPPQFPWILNLSQGPNMEFYSITSNKVYTIHAPNSFNWNLFRKPVGGYILVPQSGNRNQFRFSLLNPLNNSEVCLPALDGDICHSFWISRQSLQTDEYVVVVKQNCIYRLVVCKAGDDKWKCIVRDCFGEDCWDRLFYLKSMLFVVYDEISQGTKVIDTGSRNETYVVPDPKYEKLSNSCSFLVESSGEILRVSYHCYYDKMTDYEFEIHRLEFGNGKGHPCWVKVTSIGDQMLFFDFVADRGFSLRANDFPGYKGNRIYFIDRLYAKYHLGMYDIENGRTVFIDCPFDRKNFITWFVPTLNHI